MGAFIDLFRSKDRPTTSTVTPPQQPLWAIATEPKPRRTGFGPRAPSSSAGGTWTKDVGVVDRVGPRRLEKSRPRGVAAGGGETSDRVDAGKMRRMGSLDDEDGRMVQHKRMSQMSLQNAPPVVSSSSSTTTTTSAPPQSRRPGSPPTPPTRPVGHHQRAYSSPVGASTTSQNTTPERTRRPLPSPSHSQHHSPTRPPLPTPPVRLSRSTYSFLTTTSSTSSSPNHRPSSSIYPQALPTPPRPPLPPPPRGPDPVRQTTFTVTPPVSAPQSTTTTPGSTTIPMFPGSFPRDLMAALPSMMPEPNDSGGAGWKDVVGGGESVSFIRQQLPVPSPSSTSSSYHHSQSSSQAYHLPPPPSLPTRPQSYSAPPSTQQLPTTSSAKSKPKPKRKKPSTTVIDLCSSSSSSSESDTALSPPSSRRQPHRPSPSPSSSPTKQFSTPTRHQCHGTTHTGKRCTRSSESSSSSSPARGNTPSLLDTLDDLLDDDGVGGEDVARFCFQHSKQALAERGCFVKGKKGRSLWVEYDDWILPDLPIATKLMLRTEMALPVSDKDEEGYIYVHEMVEKKSSSSSYSSQSTTTTPRTTFLKLGRSIKPVSRLSQWRSQCPSREPIVRAIFPSSSSSSTTHAGINASLRFASKGVQNHHRWERLLLIEVAGRASLTLGGRGEGGKKVCKDCGKKHVELFEVEEGAFEEWVEEVVCRWMRWCEDVLE